MLERCVSRSLFYLLWVPVSNVNQTCLVHLNKIVLHDCIIWQVYKHNSNIPDRVQKGPLHRTSRSHNVDNYNSNRCEPIFTHTCSWVGLKILDSETGLQNHQQWQFLTFQQQWHSHLESEEQIAQAERIQRERQEVVTVDLSLGAWSSSSACL